jgi:peptidoglycan hydrolase CwlO-like protein
MMKFKFSLQRLILGLLVFIAGALFMVGQIQAQECKENACADGETACWSQAKIDCQNKINEAQTQAKTLKSAINLLNGQISLQQLQVNQTLAEIYQLETEINELSQRIEGLGYSLDRLSTVLIERVRAQYKQSRSAPSLRLLGADSLSELVNQMKYLALAQRQTADTMEKTETQRLTYDEQKILKEEKQTELNVKRSQLEAEKAIITQKRAEQQNLLDITNNSEQRYQSLRAQAVNQLQAFGRYATSFGASLLTGQTNCNGWGCYYSQRDVQWGNMSLGSSGISVATAGCLVTSVAMVITHYKGQVINPGDIANNSVFDGADIKTNIVVNGITVNRSRGVSCGTSSSCLDSELADGRPVIVKINAPSISGDHFLVILEKKDGKYIMHDPLIPNGHDLSFTDYHSLSGITRIDRISVN